MASVRIRRDFVRNMFQNLSFGIECLSGQVAESKCFPALKEPSGAVAKRSKRPIQAESTEHNHFLFKLFNSSCAELLPMNASILSSSI